MWEPVITWGKLKENCPQYRASINTGGSICFERCLLDVYGEPSWHLIDDDQPKEVVGIFKALLREIHAGKFMVVPIENLDH